MLKNRKSQLSITMIITAIIGLIILVVIVLMLTGNLGGFSKGTEEGECKGQELWEQLGGEGASPECGGPAPVAPVAVGAGENCNPFTGCQ
jgi:hypothetical protein